MGRLMVVRQGLLIKAIQMPGQRSSADAKPAQIEALKAQRSELMSQLTSLTIRRDLLHQQLANASGQSVIDLQAQLRSLDQRVKETTSDLDRIDQAAHKAVIASTGDDGATANGIVPGDISRMIQDAIGSATSGMGTSSGASTRVDNLQRVVIGLGALNGLGIVLMLVLLWRTTRWPRSGGRATSGDTDRLEHLQRAVDVIALEVERISESQRFAAKLANANAVRETSAESGLSPQE